jgi:hypothetical protein
MELRDRIREGVGAFFAIGAALVVALIVMAVLSAVVFYFSMNGIAVWMERQDPHVFDGPMTGLGPMMDAAIITVVFQIVLLGILAAFRVPFAKLAVVVVIVFYASIVASWYLSLSVAIHFEGWYPAGIFSPVAEYPVLVITPGEQAGQHHADVIEWSQLKEFCAEHPGYSFLVPRDEVDTLKAQMPNHDFTWAIKNKPGDDTLMSARFEVATLGNGRQKLVVRGSWWRNRNASMDSWYEADSRQVYPKYFEDGDTYGLYLRNAFLLVGAIDFAGLAFYLRWWWKRRSAKAVLTPAAEGA